jgi:hypothetical protein
MQAPGRKSPVAPTIKVCVALPGACASSVLVLNDCIEWMVTKHVLSIQKRANTVASKFFPIARSLSSRHNLSEP